jgi:hypothetical protein
MVAEEDRGHRVPATGYTGEKVRSYVDRHKDALSQPDAYLGTWRQSRENAAGVARRLPTDPVFTDVSRRYPTAEDALTAMTGTDQIATYALHTGREFTQDALRSALASTEPGPVRPNQADHLRAEMGFRAQREEARSRRPGG